MYLRVGLIFPGKDLLLYVVRFVMKNFFYLLMGPWGCFEDAQLNLGKRDWPSSNGLESYVVRCTLYIIMMNHHPIHVCQFLMLYIKMSMSDLQRKEKDLFGSDP